MHRYLDHLLEGWMTPILCNPSTVAVHDDEHRAFSYGRAVSHSIGYWIATASNHFRCLYVLSTTQLPARSAHATLPRLIIGCSTETNLALPEPILGVKSTQELEPQFYKYGVDIFFNGCAPERLRTLPPRPAPPCPTPPHSTNFPSPFRVHRQPFCDQRSCACSEQTDNCDLL